MKDVNAEALRELVAEHADEGEQVGPGFAVAAIKQGEDDFSALLVPFGNVNKKALIMLAEKALEMVEELYD